MKAAVLHGLDDIRYQEVTTPEIKNPSDVRVKVSCCGICRSDVPRVLNGTAHHTPLVLGHEFSGIVDDVGAEVTAVSKGDKVVGIPLLPCMKCPDCEKGNYSLCKNYSFIGSRVDGAYAEYVILPESNVFKIGDDIESKQAALFETSTIALHGFFLSEFENVPLEDDGTKDVSVAVIGTGTVGLFAVQWARVLGAKTIAILGRSEERLGFANELGATVSINTDDEDYLDKALAATSGHGFDFVFESVGEEPTIIQALKIAANKGTLCMIGTPSSDIIMDWKTWENINRKELTIKGSWMSYSDPFPGREWIMTGAAMESGALIHDDRLFYKILPLSKVEEAFEAFKNEKVRGRILLTNE